jgi:hemolysin activation/secretion protein
MMRKTLTVVTCSVVICILCLTATAAWAGDAGGSPGTGGDAMKIAVVSVVTDPSEILTEHEIRAITEKLEGKTVGVDELQQAVDQINQLYAEKNYITARAVLPPQTVTDGIVRIQLVEGRIGEILLENNRYTRDSYFLDRVRMKPGDLVKLDQMEDDLTYFNLTNDVQVMAELRPGEQFGTTDVVLKALEPQVSQVVLYTDNGGRSETGESRIGVNAVHNSLLGLRHSLTFGAVYSTGSSGLSTSYEAPVDGPAGTRGARVRVSYDESKTHIIAGQLDPVDVDTLSTVLSVKVSWPTIVSEQLQTTLSLATQSQRTNIAFSGANLVRTSVQKLELSATTQVVGASEVFQVQQSLTVDRVEASVPKSFFKYSGSLTWQRAAGVGCVFTCRGAFQLTDDHSMPSSEQFAVGGVSTVRGLPEGARMGDTGYLVSAELSYPIMQKVQGVMFIDHGAAFPYRGSGGSAEPNDYITSFGFGASMSFTDRISGNLVVGFPARAGDGAPRIDLVIQTSI